MEQITADYDSVEYVEEDKTHAAPSNATSDTSQSQNLNPFFSPRTGSVGSSSATATATSTVSSKSAGKTPAAPSKSPAARNSKKVFKHIEILSSDGDSENEEEYVPPRNYKDDGDDDSSDVESAGSGSDVEQKKKTILAEINQS